MTSYVITGGNRNVGLAFVKRLASDPGNKVIAINRGPSKEAIQGVSEIRADLKDLSSLQRAAMEIDRVTGSSLDVLILNAGGSQMSRIPIAEGREEEMGTNLVDAFRNNTVGHLQLISLLLPFLRKGKEKKIFAMTSGRAVVSKGALNIALAGLSNELRPEGFTVVSISPSLLCDRAMAEEKGADYDQIKARFDAMPGSSGVFTPDEGVSIMLDVMGKMTEKDSGRVVAEEYREDPGRWTHHFTSEEVAELSKVADDFIASGRPLTGMAKEYFPLSTLASLFSEVRKTLLEGRGFILFKGLPVVQWGLHKSAVAYMGLGTCF
ncbi:MAG: hypothetical protein TREMPRED_002315, partial [Tremellales sp. Tagirdzhanova-0007]